VSTGAQRGEGGEKSLAKKKKRGRKRVSHLSATNFSHVLLLTSVSSPKPFIPNGRGGGKEKEKLGKKKKGRGRKADREPGNIRSLHSSPSFCSPRSPSGQQGVVLAPARERGKEKKGGILRGRRGGGGRGEVAW